MIHHISNNRTPSNLQQRLRTLRCQRSKPSSQPGSQDECGLESSSFQSMPQLDVSLSQSILSHYSILPSFHYSQSLCLLLSKLRIYFHQACHDETRHRRSHDPEEEVLIAQLFLEPTTRHGGYHHAQSHDSRGDGIVDCFVFSF